MRQIEIEDGVWKKNKKQKNNTNLSHQYRKDSRVCDVAHPENYSSRFSNKICDTLLEFIVQKRGAWCECEKRIMVK